MPKGAGKRKQKASLSGRLKNTGRKLMNFVRNLGGRLRLGRGRRPKGTSGRSGSITSRRMAKRGQGGR